MPGWDNCARLDRGGIVLAKSDPDLYERWLRQTIEKEFSPEETETFVFVNAWNEWAEGNHLEPCQKWGRAYLEATKRALSTNGKNADSHNRLF